ncbi:MAG: protein kinase domain-containing protein, partial [Halanaerobiales bacterium]
SYIYYKDIEQIEGYHCLLREDQHIYTPLSVYLEENDVSLEKKMDWVLKLLEVSLQGEKNELDWPGYKLDSFWVSNDEKLKIMDPYIAELSNKYRGNFTRNIYSEVYHSPEYIETGVWDKQARFYSAGVIMYYIFTGQLPFTAENKTDLLDNIIYSQPLNPRFVNSNLSLQLSELIIQLLGEKGNRSESWNQLIRQITVLKEEKKYEATSQEKQSNLTKGEKAIRVSRSAQGFKRWWRRYWKITAVVVVLLIGFLSIFRGGRDPIVTAETTPREVVEYFYQSINEKDFMKLEAVTNQDLKGLSRMLTETAAVEKTKQYYNFMGQTGQIFDENETIEKNENGTVKENKNGILKENNSQASNQENAVDIDQDTEIEQKSAIEAENEEKEAIETGRVFGVKDVEIEEISGKPAPVFQVIYTFYINYEGYRERSMVDKLTLNRVEDKWQIVEFMGDCQYLIDRKIEELFAGEIDLESQLQD